jgi:hypothetical protein
MVRNLAAHIHITLFLPALLIEEMLGVFGILLRASPRALGKLPLGV